MLREEVIFNLLDMIDDGLIVSSNGKISRELYEARIKRKERPDDFYMVGSMGCAIPIALGVALNTKKEVYVITGDGALLMKLGALATLKKYKPDNLHVIILNNDCHDSTGGQETNFKEVRSFAQEFGQIIDVERGSRNNLGRVNLTPPQIKERFMRNVVRM